MLYGAIAGDIAGSTFEFYGMKGDEQELFPKGSEFTDDTILTLAVADSLNSEVSMADALRTYATLFPHPMGGYGSMFVTWLESGEGALRIIVSVTEVQCAFLLVPGLLIH